MEVVSQAVDVVTRGKVCYLFLETVLTITECGQRDEGRDLGSAVHEFQNQLCNLFHNHVVGTQQFSDFETNETVLGQDEYTIVHGHGLNYRTINT